jgi:hypothetical protein
MNSCSISWVGMHYDITASPTMQHETVQHTENKKTTAQPSATRHNIQNSRRACVQSKTTPHHTTPHHTTPHPTPHHTTPLTLPTLLFAQIAPIACPNVHKPGMRPRKLQMWKGSLISDCLLPPVSVRGGHKSGCHDKTAHTTQDNTHVRGYWAMGVVKSWSQTRSWRKREERGSSRNRMVSTGLWWAYRAVHQGLTGNDSLGGTWPTELSTWTTRTYTHGVGHAPADWPLQWVTSGPREIGSNGSVAGDHTQRKPGSAQH